MRDDVRLGFYRCKWVDRLPCGRVHPEYGVFHPGGHLVAARQQVALDFVGLPLDVVGAMLEGISRRYPDAKWVVDHDFGDGPMVVELGDRLDDDLDGWDEPD